MEEQKSSKIQTILIGAAIGAALGAVAGILLYQRAEQDQTKLQISGSDGVKIGLGVLTVLRSIADIGQRK
jgi:hypothetical protein